MKLRERAYLNGWLKQNVLPVPVISVGNLVLGGTGKTPVVMYIARLLKKHKYQPAVVSRGYGGKTHDKINIVSDGQKNLLSPDISGDEPWMIANSLNGVPVLTGKKRIHPCLYSVDHFGADCILLDDGFQHLQIKRDIDIVLFDATALAGNNRVFPGGELREPVAALNRSDAFLLTGINNENRSRSEKFGDHLRVKFPDKPIFTSTIEGLSVTDRQGESVAVPDEAKYFAFCGIANPSRFFTSVASEGLRVVGFHELKDHAQYSQLLLDNICRQATKSGAGRLITTEKDAVKLRSLQSTLPLHVLKINHQIEPIFDTFLIGKLKEVVASRIAINRTSSS